MKHANLFFRKEMITSRVGLLLALFGGLLLTSDMAAASALTITTTSPLPNGTVDTFYSTTFAASGGTAPYAWTITSGSVPGLAVTSTGVLTGVPAAASTYPITVQVIDSTTPTHLTATATFNITTAVSTNTNFYVSTSGSNSNNGSSGSPWATIAYAVTKAGPGITINVAPGTYNETADIAINTGGSASGGYFILKSTTPGGAIINGGSVAIGTTGYAYGLVQIGSGTNNIGYVTVDGFEVTNFKTGTSTKTNTLVPAGIAVQGSGTNIQIVNNNINNIWNQGKATNHTGNCPNGSPEAFGLVVAGTSGTTALTNISIIGNTLSNMMTGCSETMELDGNINGFIIANNLVHNNSNIGIAALGGECVASGVTCTDGYDGAANDQSRNGEIYGNTVYENPSKGTGTTPNVAAASNPYGSKCYCADGIYLDGSASNIVEQNTVYLVDLGIEVTGEGAAQNTTNNIVRDNLFFYNTAVGISIGGQGTSGGSSNSTIINNTTWDNGNNANGAIGEFATGTDLTGTNIVENNIFYASSVTGTLVDAVTTSTVTLNYNLYYAPSSSENWIWGSKTYTTFSTYQLGSKQEANSQYADPMFVNINATPPTTLPNLNVQAGSPALAKGTILSPISIVGPFDVTGVTPRILVPNDTIDVGAYEQ
ncbi:MAG: right-handed parallel beta-helix repeat-containing protein [Candidatus Sulfotelmatobacter sp.]